ncbi:unnamed protein product, partial [Pocillopora meandrina]
HPGISVVTELQLSDISDDVGTCWRELGPKLDIPAAKIQNLDNDYCCSRDKANALLLLWKQKEGRNASVGCLADALVSIGKKCIAEKLLGNLGNSGHCHNISQSISISVVSLSSQYKCYCLGLDGPEGNVIRLIVIHSLGKGLDELLMCEDAQGNKYTVKAFNSSDNFLKLEEVTSSPIPFIQIECSNEYLEKRTLQESLTRYISSKHQDLRLQMQKGPLACGNVVEIDGIKDASKDKKEPTSSLLNEEVKPPNDESVEKLLQSCEEHRNFFQRMFDVLIKLTAEVGQQSEDNVNLIQPLSDFTMELRQEKITLFSKIESVPTQSQLSDEQHVDRAEKLHKWKRRHEVRFKEVEKLMSTICLFEKYNVRKYESQLPTVESSLYLRTYVNSVNILKSPVCHLYSSARGYIVSKPTMSEPKTIDRRRCLVTEMQLASISEDVGNFWRELGPVLGIPSSKIQNLDEDCRTNWDKAFSLLILWKQRGGKCATAGILSDALERIGRKTIADRVLGGWLMYLD